LIELSPTVRAMPSSKEPIMETQITSPPPGAAGAPPSMFPTFSESLFPMQHSLTAFRRASECLLQGFMAAAAKQAEFGQKMMMESLNEWQGLSKARAPDELLQSEVSLARNQAERSISAMRAINDEIRQCCFKAVDLAVDEINAALAKPAGKHAAVKKAARTAE
jgi:hypothetical protein